MSENNFINLKLQIESLLHAHQQLQRENKTLRNKVVKLIQERAILTSKKEQICKKIKTIINQIRKGSL